MARKTKPTYLSKFSEDDMVGNTYSAAPDLPYLESKIRFSLKHCDVKKHCIRDISDDEAIQCLYTRLGYFEGMTWGQIQSINHKKGISFEKKTTDNHKVLASAFSTFSSFGHFRVNSKRKPVFRVFGAISDGLFYLLWFDQEGSINH